MSQLYPESRDRIIAELASELIRVATDRWCEVKAMKGYTKQQWPGIVDEAFRRAKESVE